jgi:hypothetical protein
MGNENCHHYCIQKPLFRVEIKAQAIKEYIYILSLL